MQQLWIDAHCHLTQRFHPAPLPGVLAGLAAASCGAIILGGVDPKDWQEQLEIPKSSVQIVPVFGLHPWTVQEQDSEFLRQGLVRLEQMLPEAAGLGECGLDYFRCKSSAERQKQSYWFEAQLQLAAQQHKPCVFHIVRAHHEALRCLKPYAARLRGLVHSFWANSQTAHAWLDLGFVLSIHPRILRGDTHHMLRDLPRDRIVFESDSPEILQDGSVSDPRLALQILQHASRIWGEDLDTTIIRQNNTLRALFPGLQPASLPSIQS